MNYELWKKQAGQDPVFVGYQRATNLIEAAASFFGLPKLDKNEDGSIKTVDGYPSVDDCLIYDSQRAAIAHRIEPTATETISGAGIVKDDPTIGSGVEGEKSKLPPLPVVDAQADDAFGETKPLAAGGTGEVPAADTKGAIGLDENQQGPDVYDPKKAPAEEQSDMLQGPLHHRV
ncbi:MAG TPA: hypothetical protein VFU05_09345 [Cyclobacteriaceae bacterium]|nr:hypothetical protein [Cyclobacteriaceae bacterium]